MTYYIPEGNIKAFETRIAKLIKRATRLNSVLAYKINRDIFQDEKVKFQGADGKTKEVFVRRFQVEVIGEEPKYAGWRFIGTLEHTVEGNVLRMVPGVDAPAQYRDCAPFCEHCKLKRTRKDTFLVRHVENGTTTQVGSGCLVDFLGHENPQALAQLASIWVSINELTALATDDHWVAGGGGISYDRQDLPRFLEYVAEIVIQDGQFWSRAAVTRISEKRGPDARLPEVTSSKAARCLNPCGPKDRHDSCKYDPSEAAINLAENARNWVLSEYGVPLPEEGGYDAIKAALLHQSRPELNDFEHNLLVVAKGEFCERRTFGIAAYIIEAYRKANNLIPERKKQPVRNNTHFGTVGQRFQKLEVTVEKVITWESPEYGHGVLFKLRTADGSLAVWRTYNVSEDNDMAEGKSYVIAATVKRHGEYNQEKQTELSRAKVTLGLLRDLIPAPQPESLEPGDDFVPVVLQLQAA